MQRINTASMLQLGLSLLMLAALFAWHQSFISVDMDELFAYHALACASFPGNRLNIFREACHQFDLKPWGFQEYLPLRSYPYAGSFRSLLYLPLYWAWPDAASARILGAIFLLLQAAISAALLQLPLALCCAIFCLFLPYACQHILDTGAIAFQATTVFAIIWLCEKWDRCSANSKSGLVAPFAIGTMIFLGIWEKLSYLFLLPGFAIFIVPVAINRLRLGAKGLAELTVLALSCLLPTAWLMTAEDVSGLPYYFALALSPAATLSGPDGFAANFLRNIWPTLLCAGMRN